MSSCVANARECASTGSCTLCTLPGGKQLRAGAAFPAVLGKALSHGVQGLLSFRLHHSDLTPAGSKEQWSHFLPAHSCPSKKPVAWDKTHLKMETK